MKLIAPSILSADFSILGNEIRDVEKAGAHWIHVDVMDGHFVPNITIGPLVVEALKRITFLPIDVHLMIENPDLYIPDFINAGATHISVHAETCVHLNRTLESIKSAGVKAGVAINPSTPVHVLDCVMEYLDYVLIMSVNPGFGGQSFIPNSLQKIADIRRIIDDKSLSVLIEVDGGLDKNTIQAASKAGTDVFVAGSAIFLSKDYKETIDTFKEKIKS